MPDGSARPFASLALGTPLWPYQRQALAAFQADVDAGRTSTHVVPRDRARR